MTAAMPGSLRIAGYASVFRLPDKGGDVVMPGAFAEAAAPIPLLWQHKPHEPIGFVDSLRIPTIPAVYSDLKPATIPR